MRSIIIEDVCNAAAIREALVAIREAMIRDSGTGPCTEFHTKVDTITQAALSAPPRNCDRFNNEDAAWGAFIKEKCKSTEKCDTMEMDCAKCAFSWLFKTAAKRKGEGDGK